MNLSDNGWSVTRNPLKLTTVRPKGTKSTFVVRRGTQDLFQELVDFLQTVESVDLPGWDGGYAYRKTRGSTTAWSTHSSGTGIDWNASRHPRGQRNTWTADQRERIRRWLSTGPGLAFKWGADFSTVPDDMHFQLRPPYVVEEVQAALRQEKEDRKSKPTPKPTPAPEAVRSDLALILYSKLGEKNPTAYQILPNGLRPVSYAEVTNLRKQGVTVAFVLAPVSDPIWKLPVL